tara:strand:- start:24 stop:398 length:375 start_codon:yes stop_codon:yes gene_type:complete
MDKGKKKKEKKEKKEALKKAIEGQKNNKKDNDKKDNDKKDDEKINYDVNVPFNFEFLCNIYNLLLTSNSRISWEPDELIPIGVTLRDLKNTIAFYQKAIMEKQEEEELKEEDLKEDEESSPSTS